MRGHHYGSHFELSPAEYEARRQGHLQRRRVRLVAAEVDARARTGDRVVELGCGPGDVLAVLGLARPDLEFVGIDVDERMVAHAQDAHGSANVTFRLADIAERPLPVKARIVFGIDVLHHVCALGPFVRSVAEMLEPDGLWVAVEPNSRNPYIWLHQERMRRSGLDEDHFRRATFEAAVDTAGLRVVDRSTAFLVPGAVASVPGLVERLESMLERVPVLGGSVVYRISP
ncbi:MAG: class I SAM-dependent methyltransferase [Gaiella sp.]|nr:class I SAM-dependent methyltransferase [Gaiella sp.]